MSPGRFFAYLYVARQLPQHTTQGLTEKTVNT